MSPNLIHSMDAAFIRENHPKFDRRWVKRMIRKKHLKGGMPALWAYSRSVMFSRIYGKD